MTENQLNRFFDILVDSIDHVTQPYMTTLYGEMNHVVHLLDYYTKRMLVNNNNDLQKTGERIFCYELYHQIRKRIELEAGTMFDNVFLQGELKKHQIEPLIERFGLERLTSNFIPDFLLHTPGNADDHPFVIEVKTDINLEHEEIKNDIDKISEFITRYHYQRGIFISVNLNLERVTEIITQGEFMELIPDINETKYNITIVAKENQLSPAEHILLSELI